MAEKLSAAAAAEAHRWAKRCLDLLAQLGRAEQLPAPSGPFEGLRLVGQATHDDSPAGRLRQLRRDLAELLEASKRGDGAFWPLRPQFIAATPNTTSLRTPDGPRDFPSAHDAVYDLALETLRNAASVSGSGFDGEDLEPDRIAERHFTPLVNWVGAKLPPLGGGGLSVALENEFLALSNAQATARPADTTTPPAKGRRPRSTFAQRQADLEYLDGWRRASGVSREEYAGEHGKSVEEHDAIVNRNTNRRKYRSE